VVAVVTVGMAAAAVVGRLMVAVVVAADLATSHLMLYRVRLLERPVTATER
jgi:type IV secretory pathway protease TraF